MSTPPFLQPGPIIETSAKDNVCLGYAHVEWRRAKVDEVIGHG
jgi:hypothetical protein